MPVTTYTTRSGDTLSGIAEQHGLAGEWEPILRYNRHLNRLNITDPSKLPINAELLIPRTRREYDEAILGLQKLILEVDKDMRTSLAELAAYKREADRVGTTVDIAADILLAAKGAVKASVTLGPRCAKYVMRKEAATALIGVAEKLIGMGDSNEELFVKSSTNAVVDQSILLQARRQMDANKLGKSVTTGLAKGLGKKAAGVSAKAIAPVEMASGVGDFVDVVCDVALAAGKGAVSVVEAVAPSKIAKLAVTIMSGEHPDDTNARVKKFVETTAQRSATRLRETITKLQNEKQAIYGH